jgi:hypothetical protein
MGLEGKTIKYHSRLVGGLALEPARDEGGQSSLAFAISATHLQNYVLLLLRTMLREQLFRVAQGNSLFFEPLNHAVACLRPAASNPFLEVRKGGKIVRLLLGRF